MKKHTAEIRAVSERNVLVEPKEISVELGKSGCSYKTEDIAYRQEYCLCMKRYPTKAEQKILLKREWHLRAEKLLQYRANDDNEKFEIGP